MTKDTWAIIGTMVMIGSIIIALGGIAINQNSQLNTRITDLRDGMNQRFDDVNQRITDTNERITDGIANVQRQIDELQGDVRELRSMQFEALKNQPPAN